MPRLLLVSSDLLWVGKAGVLARRAGWELAVPDKKTEVTHLLLDGDTQVVAVDLHHPRFDFVETVRLVRGTRWDAHLVCFGHHTDAARMQRARDLGAQDVVPNSAFEARLAALLGLA
jgi:DNA-binding NarL/FixJ family response regulator